MKYDWTEERIKYLHELLYLQSPTPTTAEIGRLFGCSKNAVIGKAGRMRRAGHDFPARPNPVKLSGRDMRQMRRDRRKALPQVKALPPLKSEETLVDTVTWVAQPVALRPVEPAAPKVAKPVVVTPVFVWRQHKCCWPMNDGKPDWLWCGSPTLEGKQYCREHHRRAHVSSWREREEQQYG